MCARRRCSGPIGVGLRQGRGELLGTSAWSHRHRRSGHAHADRSEGSHASAPTPSSAPPSTPSLASTRPRSRSSGDGSPAAAAAAAELRRRESIFVRAVLETPGTRRQRSNERPSGHSSRSDGRLGDPTRGRRTNAQPSCHTQGSIPRTGQGAVGLSPRGAGLTGLALDNAGHAALDALVELQHLHQEVQCEHETTLPDCLERALVHHK